MVKILLATSILLYLSCIPFHTDKYGNDLPKYFKYTLKDKVKDAIPKELDTLNVYENIGYYSEGKFYKSNFSDNPNWKIYHKFCPNGRVYGFGTDSLSPKYLNPNMYSPGYYIFDKSKNEIIYQTFVTQQGGQFIKIKYTLSKTGDSLIGYENGKMNDIHVRRVIPKEWKRHKPNW